MWPYVHNDYLYSFVEMQRAALEPYRNFAKFNKDFNNQFLSHTKVGRSIAASYEMFERLTRHYPKPEFGITETKIGTKLVKIEEKIVARKTFCNLLHFKKKNQIKQPKILVISPLSGHHATLLRGTVRGLLPHYDVYITDWLDARDIPLDKGSFNFDDFTSYLITFMQKLSPGLNVLAVCQPSVPALTAVALMSSAEDPKLPKTLTMMGGPIDTRKSPTEVNDYAAERTIDWFENNVITKVPFNYAGVGREVYPGFTQLSGFMSMNMHTHMGAYVGLFNHLVEGDGESAAAHKKFYNEYLSVMDLPAEFYLDTVNIVFKEHLLPRGKLQCLGKTVDLSSIKKTSILCIEGEKDDISGVGQTKAAIKLCKNLPDNKKQYHLQKNVGHYGIFNGRRYREQVVPVICKFTGK